jgi:predicted signal transduction protein with EAL and GGDEF domain
VQTAERLIDALGMPLALPGASITVRASVGITMASPGHRRSGGAGSLAAPTRGLLAPGEFIPLAETSGLIVDLGRSILERACRQASHWRGGTELMLGVNLSPGS